MSLPDDRWVFDTNAVVSAALFKTSVPGKALYVALDKGQFLLSKPTLSELKDVLGRSKFDKYLTREERDQFLYMVVDVGIVVDANEEIRECRDPKDDKFLELAVSGQATCIISGDPDLLVLNPFREIPILTPALFLNWLAKRGVAGD